MRAGFFWLAALLLPLIFAACGDLSTDPRAVPGDKTLMGCYDGGDGTVKCDPVSPIWDDECDPYTQLDWSCDDDTCMTSVQPRPGRPGGDMTTQGCPGTGGGGGGGGGGGTTTPTLTCSAVVRGQQTTCQVTTGTVVGWEFVDEWGSYPGPTSGQSWTGPAVKSGTVTATLSDGKMLAAFLVVTARGWRWGTGQWSFTQGGGPANCDTGEPAIGAAITWGWNRTRLGPCNDDAGRYLPNMRTTPYGGFTTGEVTSGPNAGFWYVTAVRYYMDRGSNINPSLTSAGTKRLVTDPNQAATCRANMGLGPSDPVYVNFYTFNEICMGVDVDGILGAVWLHEGFGSTGANGHESVARSEAIKVDNDPYVLGDTLVNRDNNYLQALMANTAWEQNTRVTNLGASHTYVNGNWSGNTQYWMWSPSTGRYELANVPANI